MLLTDRVGSRDKVSEILMGIECAVGSEEVRLRVRKCQEGAIDGLVPQTMAALSLGTATLRTLISSPTLSLDHIGATTTALADALADADDINQAVDAGGVALPSDQEDDVERELREMVQAAEVEERKAKDLDELRKKEADEAARKASAAEAETASLEARVDDRPTAVQHQEQKSETLLEGMPKPPSAVTVQEGRQMEHAQ